MEPGVDVARKIIAMLEAQHAGHSELSIPRSAPARALARALLELPGDDRSIEQLSASVHVSARTIERAFRAETGITLRAWRIRNRMLAASTLLRDRVAIDRVARAVGYLDTNAFRRVFKTHFGITPSAYAAQSRTITT